MEHRANPISFVLAGVLVLMAVLVGIRGCTGREPTTTEASMEKVPEAPPADVPKAAAKSALEGRPSNRPMTLS